MKRNFKGLPLLILSVSILAVIGMMLLSDSEPATPVSLVRTKLDKSETLRYQVVKEITKVGLPSQNRAIIKIVILADNIPTEEAMRHTATGLWHRNRHWNEFTVFIYLPGMASNGVAYGMFEFGPSGLQDSFISDWYGKDNVSDTP